MSELEDTTEHLHEKIHEEAHHVSSDPKSKWILMVALFTALVSVLAALSGLLSSHHENEALLAQIKASDQWNYYQAKGIKSEIVSSAMKAVHAGEVDTASDARIEKYKTEQEQIKQKAEGLEKETEENLALHIKLSRAVTLFQISIAVSAISILTRRKLFWYIGICFSLAACYFLLQGVF
jgi:lipopolysaccharide export LptBFGC system permease protein LptF